MVSENCSLLYYTVVYLDYLLNITLNALLQDASDIVTAPCKQTKYSYFVYLLLPSKRSGAASPFHCSGVLKLIFPFISGPSHISVL
jgi:hypothetical protein